MAEFRNGGSLIFEAYDKDVGSSDLLGFTDPLEVVDLVHTDKVQSWNIDMFEKNGEHAGSVKLTTQLLAVKPDPPIYSEINYNCQLEIKMKGAEFLKDDGDALGKQDPFL